MAHVRLVAIAPILVLVACATAPSHDGFVRILHNNIGKSIDTELTYCFQAYHVLGISALPNGREEYKHLIPPHRGVGSCPYSCEVDPRTRTVVAVRIDGLEKDCVQFP